MSVTPIVQIRFAYDSGSERASSGGLPKEELFQPDVLESLFNQLKDITVPSLEAQENKDFRLAVLTSHDLPALQMAKVTQLIGDTFGDRAEVIPRKPSPEFRQFIRHNRAILPPGTEVAQTALDVGQAVSTDFIWRVRKETMCLRKQLPDDVTHFFLSLSRGLSMVFDGDDKTPKFYNRDMPYTSIGLTSVSDVAARLSPYRVSPRKIGRQFPSFVYNDLMPYYLRLVPNGTEGLTGFDADGAVRDDVIPKIVQRFPLLRNFLPKGHLRVAAE
ncbi:glycosyltransferase [Pseudooceanicola sp. C21-150M6]|uniref:glycosyltransferase n=1 Tax=Pseudooceanicola sp. C21-150M6 TaxID=3434355 RepID=UPI003D7FE4B6